MTLCNCSAYSASECCCGAWDEPSFIQFGFWVVGDKSAKFGAKQIGDTFTMEGEGSDCGYWISRGYRLIPNYVSVDDYNDYLSDKEFTKKYGDI